MELLNVNNWNVIVLILEQACNIVNFVGTMNTVPKNFKCKLEYIPDDSYMIIWWLFVMF